MTPNPVVSLRFWRLHMKATFEKEGTIYAVDTDKLPQASIEYLLQYGFAQSLQDCIAGRAKAVKAEREKAGDDADAIELAVLSDIDGKLNKRVDAIVAGTMGMPTARDPIATLAKEIVERHVKAMNKKVTKEKLAELVATYVEKSRPALLAELNRRRTAATDIDLDI